MLFLVVRAQLYAQAGGLLPTLRRKVQEWASAAGGSFAVKGQAGVFERWGQQSDGMLLGDDEGWSFQGLKDVERAVEKVARVYGGEVSRLCDICRETIVFDDLQQILHCMENLIIDTKVRRPSPPRVRCRRLIWILSSRRLAQPQPQSLRGPC
jgi:hypothetical protein